MDTAQPHEVLWTVMGLIVACYIGRLTVQRYRAWTIVRHGSPLEALTAWQRLVLFSYLVFSSCVKVAIGIVAMTTPPRPAPEQAIQAVVAIVFLVAEFASVLLALYMDNVARRTDYLIEQELQSSDRRADDRATERAANAAHSREPLA